MLNSSRPCTCRTVYLFFHKVVNEKTNHNQVQGDNPHSQQGNDESIVSTTDPVEEGDIYSTETNADYYHDNGFA